MADRGRIQKSFLGEAATRIIRALNLDGLVTPDYEPGEKIQPVIIVANGLEAGMSDRRGRRWVAATIIAGGGATHSCGIKVGEDTVLTAIQLTSTDAAGSEYRGFLAGPNDADPFAMATAGAIWVDRAVVGTEAAPVGIGQVTPQVVAGGGNLFRHTSQANANPFSNYLPEPVMLFAGSKVWVSSSGIADMRVVFWGRTF